MPLFFGEFYYKRDEEKYYWKTPQRHGEFQNRMTQQLTYN